MSSRKGYYDTNVLLAYATKMAEDGLIDPDLPKRAAKTLYLSNVSADSPTPVPALSHKPRL